MRTIILMNDKGGKMNAAIFGDSEAEIEKSRSLLNDSVVVYPVLVKSESDMLKVADKVGRVYDDMIAGFKNR